MFATQRLAALAFSCALLAPSALQAANEPDELGCVRGDCENGEGTLVLKTAEGRTRYTGYFRNGEYHGYGRLEYLGLGKGYAGYWENGERDGRGTYWERVAGTLYSFDVYIGQWRDDRRYGHGTQAYKVENWRENRHTEQWLKDNSENYTGNFQNDVFFGEGTYRWADGTKYVGEWVANKQHGDGYYDYGNGMISRRTYDYGERVFGF